MWVENRVSWLGGEGGDARLLVLSRRLQPGELAAREPRSPGQASEARIAAGYVRDLTNQLAQMADGASLPTSAVALRLALALMREEHEDVAPGVGV